MEIKISGNCESFYITGKINYVELSLIGDFGYQSNSKIQLKYNDVVFEIDSVQSLFQISEEIKGATQDRILLIANDKGFSDELKVKLKKAKSTEISLFKSVFLIYQWIEYDLSIEDFDKLTEKVHDDFIIDYGGNIGPQDEIYFIPKDLLKEDKLPIIQRLIDLNLLVSMSINANQYSQTSYFIPLIKPGIPKKYFQTEFDKSGNLTYDFWKSILYKRDYRLSKWSQSRY